MRTRFHRSSSMSNDKKARIIILLFLVLVIGLNLSGFDQYRYLPYFTLEQITQTRVIHEFAISADGTKVAYTYGGYDVQRFGEDNNIWMVNVETGEIRKMTSGLYHKTNPCFSYAGFKMYMRLKCAGLSLFLRLGESAQFLQAVRHIL